MDEGDSIPAPPSEVLQGRYRLTRRIGRGGMGEVWEGVHLTLDTRVAIKFIDAELARNPEARSRFENEARAAARLQSKYVVTVHDHGLLADGRPYIVMEYLGGEALDKRLERVGRLSYEETVRFMRHVARGLTRAHAAGIVHRDLKPENVFIVRDAEDGTEMGKVVDFGIAKFTEQPLGTPSSTRTGSLMGTPYYMSPEQARGLKSVDFRSDLWAMGVLTYRCVTGELPFDGEAVGDLLVKVCTAPLPVPSQRVPSLPATFDEWFGRALAREPEQRFASAAELADALAVALEVDCGPALSVTDGTRAPRVGGARAGSASGGSVVDSATMGPLTQQAPPPAPAARHRNSRTWLGATLLVLGVSLSWVAWRARSPALVPALSASAALVAPEPTPAAVSTEPALGRTPPLTEALAPGTAESPVDAGVPPALSARAAPATSAAPSGAVDGAAASRSGPRQVRRSPQRPAKRAPASSSPKVDLGY